MTQTLPPITTPAPVETSMEPEITENPLRESRLNDSRDFRPEWDVAALNAWVSKSLLQDIDRIAGRREPDPGQMIPVLLSPGGYGKTHLFGRLGFELKDRAFFVFVGAIPDPLRPLEHIRWCVVEALFRSQPGKPSMLARALANLFRHSMVEYIRLFPPSEAFRYQGLLHELHEGNDAVFRIAESVKNLRSFQRLADSAAEAMPDVHASVVKALVLGWSPQHHLARRWLRGEGLTEDEAKLVGLDEESPPPLQVLKGVAAILQYRVPMVICCDQLDSVVNYPEGPTYLADHLMQVLASIPCQFLALSCLENEWKQVTGKRTLDAFRQRTHEFRLEFLTEDQAIALLSKRLASWPQHKPELGALWPFDRASIEEYVRDMQPTPRVFIKRCAAAFDRWMAGELTPPIAIGEGSKGAPTSGVAPSLAALFQQEWERELDSIRKNLQRTPEHVEEARLYKALRELLLLAKSSGKLPGGLGVEGYEFDVLNTTAANPKYGLRVDLRTRGSRASIILAASKVNGGARVVPFVKELFNAGESATGIVLVHPRSDFTMGPAARKLVDDGTSKGKLIIYSLEDHRATFESLECALTLLEQAHSNDLTLGTAAISYEQCQNLIIDTKVIDNLDLFTALASWCAPPGPASVTATPAPPAPPAPAPAPKRIAPAAKPSAANNGSMEITPKAQPVAKKAKAVVVQSAVQPAAVAPEPSLFTKAPSTPAADGDIDTAWAAEKLALAAAKLSGWDQQVEPDSFNIGPSFIRLNVRPAGRKTTFKRVCDRATDLKTHLGLDIEPIIETHSYFFTIDIQRPHRQVVTLEQAMAQAPEAKENDPLFPLGLDVSGKAHWVNLSDPTDCHLLVAGTTGSGKSEFLKSILASLAHRLTPEQIQFVLIDPKRVTFNFSGSSPYLKNPVSYDIESALPLLKECEQETSRRYNMLQKMQMTDVGQLEGSQTALVPRIVIIIDEFANLMDEKETNKALVGLLKKIGAMSRAAGIHLILATQRPDSTVVPMLVRSNLPGKIALQVDSEQNSKLILDSPAAAYLLGKGDLLCKRGGSLIRAQSPMVPQAELEKLLRL